MRKDNERTKKEERKKKQNIGDKRLRFKIAAIEEIRKKREKGRQKKNRQLEKEKKKVKTKEKEIIKREKEKKKLRIDYFLSSISFFLFIFP